VLGQPRAVQRYTARVRDDEGPLTGRIVELASVYGRYGSPRITGMLRNEGWNVNHKRVERIWRQAGLKVPRKQPRRGRLWLNDGSCVRLRPERRDHVWACDFVLARTHEGLPLRLLVVVDEWTRECLSIDVARQLGSDDVLERLSWLMATRGVPDHVHSDNGSEFTATAVRDWLGKVGVKTLYIEPGSPWENGCVESLNQTARRAAEWRDLLHGGGGTGADRAVARALQPCAPAQRARVPPPPAPEAIAAGPPSASLRAVQQRLSNRTTTAKTVDSTAGEGQSTWLAVVHSLSGQALGTWPTCDTRIHSFEQPLPNRSAQGLCCEGHFHIRAAGWDHS